MWEYFKGKENTDQILKEKGENLAHMLVGGINGAVYAFLEELKDNKNIELNKDASAALIYEMVYLSLHLTARVTLEVFSDKKAKIFLESLYLKSREILANEFSIKDRNKVRQFNTIFDDTYVQRDNEYIRHGLESPSPEEAWGEKHTLYQTFGKISMDLIDLRVDLPADRIFQTLYIYARIPMELTRELLTYQNSASVPG